MLSVWVCTYLLNRAKENILSKLTPFDLCTLVPCLHAVLQIYKLQLLIRAKFKLLNSQNAKLHLDIYGCISAAMKSCDHALFLQNVQCCLSIRHVEHQASFSLNCLVHKKTFCIDLCKSHPPKGDVFEQPKEQSGCVEALHPSRVTTVVEGAIPALIPPSYELCSKEN